MGCVGCEYIRYEVIKIGGEMTKYTKCLKCGRIYDDQAIIFSERDEETGVETSFCECGSDLDDSIEFIICPFCENHATVYKPCLCDSQSKAIQGWTLPLDKLSELGFDVEGIQGNVANLYATPDYKFKMSYLNGEVEYPESETPEIISMLKEGGLL